MKKRIIGLMAVGLFLTGCSITPSILDKNKTYELVDGAYVNLKKDGVSVFEEVKVKDIIEDTNVEGIADDIYLDTETIGKNKINIDYKFNNKKHKYTLEYEVVDKTAPIFLSAATSKTILVNDDTNPCDSINIADNYSRVPTCEIKGEYNIEKVGKYNVKYVIKDEQNNTNEKELTINVVKELPQENNKSSAPVSEMIPISTIINKYKKSNTEIGIDVSRWQGDVDYNAVKAAGVEFVMMRIGVSNDIDEDLSMDSKYQQNIKNAKEAGLKVGVYVYTTAINDDMARDTAKWVLNILDGTELDLPVVFDWENWSKFRKYQISIHDLNKAFLTFASVIEEKGYKPMLYGSKYYLENMWEEKTKNKYPVWLAHYTNDMTNYQGKFMMWQTCSDGRVDGINGDVDIDIMYK